MKSTKTFISTIALAGLLAGCGGHEPPPPPIKPVVFNIKADKKDVELTIGIILNENFPRFTKQYKGFSGKNAGRETYEVKGTCLNYTDSYYGYHKGPNVSKYCFVVLPNPDRTFSVTDKYEYTRYYAVSGIYRDDDRHEKARKLILGQLPTKLKYLDEKREAKATRKQERAKAEQAAKERQLEKNRKAHIALVEKCSQLNKELKATQSATKKMDLYNQISSANCP